MRIKIFVFLIIIIMVIVIIDIIFLVVAVVTPFFRTACCSPSEFGKGIVT